MRPLIAVPGRRAARVTGLRFAATVAAEAICEAVWSAGGEPLVLHGPDDPATELEHRLRRVDGMLLPGGGDMDPRRYGQEPVSEAEEPSAHQDAFDFAAVRAALDLELPTVVICRGLQVLNVLLGGTLVQHLAETTVAHRDALHDVSVTEGSLLHGIVRRDRIQVSSYHHQAVDSLGRDLRVTATADDGCVEALEHAAGHLLAVQWHPEDLHATSDSDAALFGDLVERAGKHAVR